ncbi:MAG: hypothetical protein ACI39G_05715 [Pseudoramibacter sp.]
MKNWKLVSGILSIVFCAVILFQSCAAGVYNTLEANGEISGSAGVMVAILMLAGGIVSVATRQSTKKGGNIAMLVVFLLAAMVGFGNAGSYSDLKFWSVWCLICAVLSVVAIVLNKRGQNSQGKDLK